MKGGCWKERGDKKGGALQRGNAQEIKREKPQGEEQRNGMRK